jgi:5-methylcytosine-specific restriction endonuclease McrA
MLLTQGKAAVWRRYPFTLILKTAMQDPRVSSLRIKIDPGSKTTGVAVVNDAMGQVVFAAELVHQGDKIARRLQDRRAVRRSRRQRKTRYRKPRFDNRRNKKKGWLAPSLASRISNIETWVKRLCRICPITALSQEVVRFDLQARDRPDIAGMEYQQGTLAGYEIREYVLEKWGRQCTYCGATGVPLQLEHIHARSQSRDDRVCNLCPACETCNQAKGTQDIGVFLAHKPDLLKRVLAQTKAPLRDAAAVNATRWALYERLKIFGLPVECGSGGLTKYNRVKRGLEKTHWLDAVCVGHSTPDPLDITGVVPILISATGHGCRQMCLMDRYGFPRAKPKALKRVHGFQTGDLVRAVVTTGTKQGTYVGRVAVRASGSFDITTATSKVQGISHRFCTTVQRVDGYNYQKGEAAWGPTA